MNRTQSVQAATPAGNLFFENIGSTYAEGAEVEVEAKQESGCLARASSALQRAGDPDTRSELTRSPTSLDTLNLGWSPRGRGLSAGIDSRDCLPGAERHRQDELAQPGRTLRPRISRKV